MRIKKELKILMKICILVLLFFGANVYFSYAADTYCTFKIGFKEAALDMAMRNGRPIIGVLYELHYLSGLSKESFYYISTFFALIFLIISIFILEKILSKHGISENIGILLSFASIANIFIIEYFMLIEKSGFMLAILFDVFSIYFMEKFFEVKKIKHLIVSMIIMVMAVYTYQGTIALFVILSLPFAFKYAKNIREYVQNVFYIGVVYSFSVIIDLLSFKFVFQSSRISEKINYLSNLKTLIEGLRVFSVSTFEILPKYFFLIILFTILLISALLGNSHKRKYNYILSVIVIVLASVIFSTATIIQGAGWWSTRTTYPLTSVIGALIINQFINLNDFKINKKTIDVFCKLSITFLSILVIVQFFSFNKIFIDKYKLNALDQYRCEYIGQAINDYQNSTGITIKNIAFYSDAARTYPPYSNLYSQGDLIFCALYPDWSNIEVINYYLSENYIKVSQKEKYTKYFEDKDWSHLSKDQLIFDGDTLHLCIY